MSGLSNEYVGDDVNMAKSTVKYAMKRFYDKVFPTDATNDYYNAVDQYYKKRIEESQQTSIKDITHALVSNHLCAFDKDMLRK